MTPTPIPSPDARSADGGEGLPALYNEHDPYAADWLRNLIAEGHIAPGRVDTRSIVDLRPSDLDGVGQFHAFAGIGGWSLALQLAGVPDSFPIWTGSCPCQPFSNAGRRAGFDDPRHLWPAWFRLIRERRPAIVAGEQVEAAVRLGWLDTVFADLESEGYACGAAVLGAHSLGAPHIRQRLWFVADAGRERRDGQPARLREPGSAGRFAADRAEADGNGETDCAVADSIGPRLEGRDARSLGNECQAAERGGSAGRVGDADRREHGGLCEGPERLREPGGTPQRASGQSASETSDSDPWSDLDWLSCRDGKARPTQPGLQPLAHGLSGRVGKLRAAGNAIVPQVAAAFIAAALATLPSPSRPDAARGPIPDTDRS